jgi:tetratricopeptide (TPR) repeat protein
MNGLSSYPVLRRFVSLVLFCSSLASAAAAREAISADSGVNLKCTIVGDAGDPPRSVWLIELYNSAGAPLRRALRMAGETVHFNDLAPGIYRILMSGRQGRRRTESIDLTPPRGKHAHTFARDLKAPQASPPESGVHTVKVERLAVPDAAVEEMKRARKEQIGGNEERMLGHLRRAIDLCKDYAEAWNDLGAYYNRRQDYKQAIRIFSKVTILDPDLAAGWSNLGSSLLSTGEFVQAIEANRKALSLAPDDALAASQLALSHYYLHHSEEAKAYFKLAFDLDPASSNLPQLFLAHLALAESDFGAAREYFVSYLTYHPNLPNTVTVRQFLAQLDAGSLIKFAPGLRPDSRMQLK